MSDTHQNSIHFWDKHYSENRSKVRLHYPEYSCPETVKMLRKFNVTTVLDAGGGFGRYAVPLARAGFDVTCCDISTAGIEIIKEWAKEEGLKIRAEVMGFEEMSRFGESFDAVICSDAIDHVKYSDARQFISIAKNRLLKPGGVFYVSFDGFREFGDDKVVQMRDGTYEYVDGEKSGMLWRYWADDEIYRLLKDFEIIEIIENDDGDRFIWCRI